MNGKGISATGFCLPKCNFIYRSLLTNKITIIKQCARKDADLTKGSQDTAFSKDTLQPVERKGARKYSEDHSECGMVRAQ